MMLENQYFENIIHQDIDESINSNLSIDSEVEQKCDEISTIISNKIHKQTYEKFDEIERAVFSFNFDFLEGKTISFVITNYNFKDKNEFLLLKNKYYDILNTSKMSYDGKSRICFMWINSCSINFKLNKVITNDNIQHEISHFFQDIKFGGILPNDNLYNIAYMHLNDKNEIVRLISQSIYYSYNFEQDGFVNGLNQFIKNCDNNNPFIKWDDIKESSCYEALENLRKNIYLLKNKYNKKDIQNICKKIFYMSHNDFTKMIENSEKRFLAKIGRVFYKHRKKVLNNGLRINENIINNNFLTFY